MVCEQTEVALILVRSNGNTKYCIKSDGRRKKQKEEADNEANWRAEGQSLISAIIFYGTYNTLTCSLPIAVTSEGSYIIEGAYKAWKCNSCPVLQKF